MDPSDRNCGNYDWRHIWSHLGFAFEERFYRSRSKKKKHVLRKILKWQKAIPMMT